ncbi:uncharacterized protein METZ01_LOCUS77129 [marine metagenome]|uniref:Membrane transporter protein n=1 Tax=marine metagenome TaxID=408172 RepID=A0A381U7Q0_9ZZZZ
MELINYSIEMLVFLFAIGGLAGFLNTLGGCGGLLTIPALLMSGISPIFALGTHKLQTTVGVGSATVLLLKKKKFDWREIRPIVITAFLGALVGAFAVQYIDTDTLSVIVPIVLVITGVYFLVAPKLRKFKTSRVLSYRDVVVPAIGFYDGMFGPGTGSFFVMATTVYKRIGLITASIIAKPLNFSTNIASVIVFISYGHIVWELALLMMISQIIGSILGAHYLIKANPAVIRVLIVVVSFAMMIKYFYDMGII